MPPGAALVAEWRRTAPVCVPSAFRSFLDYPLRLGVFKSPPPGVSGVWISACLLTRDLPAARAALQRAAEAASKASEALQRLAAEVEGHDLDGPLPDWED